MTGHMSLPDVLLVAIAVAAFTGCLGVRLALWWAGPRKVASQSIDAGVAYLRSLPPPAEARLPLRAPVVSTPAPTPVPECDTAASATRGDLEIALR